MKRNRCNECHQEIERYDFFMETKHGKICSDCLVEPEAVDADTAHLYATKKTKEETLDGNGILLTFPLKEAL